MQFIVETVQAQGLANRILSVTQIARTVGGPAAANPRNGSALGAIGTSPTVGRNPTTLLKLAGLRSEPARSLQSAPASMPAVTPAAAPPLEPPAHLLGSPNGAPQVCRCTAKTAAVVRAPA